MMMNIVDLDSVLWVIRNKGQEAAVPMFLSVLEGD